MSSRCAVAVSIPGGDAEAEEAGVLLLRPVEEGVGGAEVQAAASPGAGVAAAPGPRRSGSRSVLAVLGAGVALMVLGTAAPALSWRPARPAAAAPTGETLQLFGDLSIRAREAPRRLFDLDFRWDDDAEAGGQCTIDVVQAVAYLGQAAVFLYKANENCPEPREDDLPCGIAPATVLTSFTWIASYLSLAAHSCAQSLGAWPSSEKMFCAADVSGFVANLGELATCSQAAAVDCDYSDEGTWAQVTQNNSELNRFWQLLSRSNDTASLEKALRDRARDLKDFLYPLGAHLRLHPYGPAKEVLGRRRLAEEEEEEAESPLLGFLKGLRERREVAEAEKKVQVARQWDIAQCVFDVTQSASYIVRAAFQIHAAAGNCPDPRACTLDIFNILSSFAWISQFTAYAVADCGVLEDVAEQNAYCAGDISDGVAATTSLVAVSMAFQNDCRDSAA